MKKIKTGIQLISEERKRQILGEGFNLRRDQQYEDGELARAAATYALPDNYRSYHKNAGPGFLHDPMAPKTWPWMDEFWKPDHLDRIKDLTKAGALIAAEIDRLQFSQYDHNAFWLPAVSFDSFEATRTILDYIATPDLSQVKPKPCSEVKHSSLFSEEFKTNPHFMLNLINDIVLRRKGISKQKNFIENGNFSIFEVFIDSELEALKSMVPSLEEYMIVNRDIFNCDSDENVFAFDLAVKVHFEIFGLWLKYDFENEFYHLSKIE